MRMETPITERQIKKIHVLLKEKNVGEEEYRDLLQEHFGVSTSKKLTKRQASELIDLLIRFSQPKKTFQPESEPLPEPELIDLDVDYITPSQARLLEALVESLRGFESVLCHRTRGSWYWAISETLEAFGVKRDDFSRLTKDEALDLTLRLMALYLDLIRVLATYEVEGKLFSSLEISPLRFRDVAKAS